MIKTTTESKIISHYKVMPDDLNEKKTLFGAKLLRLADSLSGSCAIKHRKGPVATVSVDSFEFLKPFHVGDFVNSETFISGVGNRSMEIFTKFICENPISGEKYVGAICFLTFHAKNMQEGEKLSEIEGITEEEKSIIKGYPLRRKLAKERQQRVKEILNVLEI